MQNLETTLADITAKLRQGKFPNEQSISQGSVLRILQELGWDIHDPSAVWPSMNESFSSKPSTSAAIVNLPHCNTPSKLFVPFNFATSAQGGPHAIGGINNYDSCRSREETQQEEA